MVERQKESAEKMNKMKSFSLDSLSFFPHADLSVRLLR